MDVGVLDQRFSLSGYWQGKSLVSRVGQSGKHTEACDARKNKEVHWAGIYEMKIYYRIRL